MILTPAQANGAYGAIVYLRSIGGSFNCTLEAADGRGINIAGSELGGVVVGTGLHASKIENYKTLHDFATAYDLI